MADNNKNKKTTNETAPETTTETETSAVTRAHRGESATAQFKQKSLILLSSLASSVAGMSQEIRDAYNAAKAIADTFGTTGVNREVALADVNSRIKTLMSNPTQAASEAGMIELRDLFVQQNKLVTAIDKASASKASAASA